MVDGNVLLYVKSINPLPETATVGQRIRYWREKLYMTQVKLCELTGINRHSMIHYENDTVLNLMT